MSSSTVQTLTGNIPSSSANDALFTTLCTHKDDADRINASRLAQVQAAFALAGVSIALQVAAEVTRACLQLGAESHMFEADDHGSDADCRELKYTPCPYNINRLLVLF